MIFTTFGVFNGFLITASSLYLKNIFSPDGNEAELTEAESLTGKDFREMHAKLDTFLMFGCFIIVFSAYG